MLEVRRLREAKGWNQTELAFHAGLAPSVISQIENGKREPSARTLRKLAGGLGVEVADLFPKAEAPLWSDESTDRRVDPSFTFREVRESLERYCQRWEKLLANGELDDRAIEEFLATGNGWLPALDVALSAEISAAEAAGEQGPTEIGKANRRYLDLFSEMMKILRRRIEEGRDKHPDTHTNVVRLQEARERFARLPNRAVG